MYLAKIKALISSAVTAQMIFIPPAFMPTGI